MTTPNPLAKTKGAGTTFWMYTGKGDAFANPLSDTDWLRLAMVKDLQPGEMTADAEDDTYLDDEDADWKTTTQGQKSVGDTSATLAWRPGDSGQKKLVQLFDSGEVCAFRIKYPNGTVDVFRGWLSSLGKTIASKDVMTRTVKISGVGRPYLAEEGTEIVGVISGEPEEYFRMSPEDWLRAEMQGEIVALVHSHPGGLPWLSEADRRLQVQSDLPWWLVCRGEIHKFRCVPHLTGRRFEHGVTDCYTLFRDAYHLAGIEMPDFHRGDDWWRNGQNLYLDNLEATGLYQVPLSAAQPGDVLLCCFGSSVPNHAAIYCGDGELLHHIPEQLSKRERYTDKWQRRTHSLWRHRAWHASAFTGICNDLAAASTFV